MPGKHVDFEKKMQKLEKIVQDLEKGDLSLEKGVRLFKEGLELTKSCRDQLEKAKYELSIVTESGGDEDIES
jgi:exodeoxyribonuclease VII small subunit